MGRSPKRLFTREHIERAKRAYAQGQRSHWELADVLVEAFPRITRVERGAQGYPTFTYEVGEFLRLSGLPMSAEEVRRLRRLALVFPPAKRKRASLTAHERLVASPERLEDDMTVQQAEVAAKGYSNNAAPRTAYTASEGIAVALRFVKGSMARLDGGESPELVGQRIATLESAVDELVAAFDGLAIR